MKTTDRILFLTAAVAALTLSAGARGSESVSSARVPTQQGLAASPRYLEEHPELSRIPQSGEASKAKTANRGFATSPRFLEMHPELLRPQSSAEKAQSKVVRIRMQLARLMENRAWAASPRALERFPSLMRGVTFGSVVGGSPKLVELGK